MFTFALATALLQATPTDTPSDSTPTPTAPATARCAVPNAPARVVKLVQPTYSEYMRINHKEGLVDVRVFLAPSGAVARAEVAKSSGDAFLDGATYDAAIATTYGAEISNCVPIAGSYIYRTRFRSSNDETPAPSASPTSTPHARYTIGPALPIASHSPTPTPAPSPTPAPTPSPSPSPSPSETSTPSPSPAPTPRPKPTHKPKPSPSPRATTYATTLPTTLETTYPTSYPTTVATTIPATTATSYATTLPTTVPVTER